MKNKENSGNNGNRGQGEISPYPVNSESRERNQSKGRRRKVWYGFLWAVILGVLCCQLTALPVQARYVSIDEKESTELPEYSLLRFLQTALQPVGKTVYIWGGGWNEEDTAAGVEAVSIGVSPRWESYFVKQTADYDYTKTRYRIHDGLDCSGYVGWSLYNFWHSVDGGHGYVMKAKDMAESFATRGWGSYTPAGQVRDYRAGDIMSGSGHVYIVLGSCADGSVLLAHSSPPGVQLSGTVSAAGSSRSQAAALAEHYMQKYYPEWYQKFQTRVLPKEFLRQYAQMRWTLNDRLGIKDDERLQEKTAAEVMRLLLGE